MRLWQVPPVLYIIVPVRFIPSHKLVLYVSMFMWNVCALYSCRMFVLLVAVILFCPGRAVVETQQGLNKTLLFAL